MRVITSLVVISLLAAVLLHSPYNILKSLILISATYLILVVTDAESCPNQNITDWSGTFQPSSYPSNYAPNLDCYWLFQVSDGNLIEINFQDFEVNS